VAKLAVVVVLMSSSGSAYIATGLAILHWYLQLGLTVWCL